MKNTKIVKAKFHSNFVKFIVFSVITFSAATVTAQTKKPHGEQSSFSSEEKISDAVDLPSNILKQLTEYDDGQLAKCQRDKLTRRSNIAAHFAAAEINLNGDKLSDLIVQAQTLCFMGAHNTTFWLFTRTNSKSGRSYQPAFDIAADYLKILNSSTKGFRDIETASHTAVELYTIKWIFDGEKYRQSECTVSDENEKVSKIECRH